ncbi:hypothetical protein D9615_003379 [Tricholomella constricta]|uniref:Protein SMG7 n=1 Tax=Tricholomella constricta TaxID=117010 RepID=A0A8H5M7L0_9AGAR|nr:hypothetical protein D9615_003379 [Tricholomella constricta]
MTEQPANIARWNLDESREAKGIHQSLKELLKNREPFDKEVDFQRKNLRRRYLSLLLVHPYAKESKDVENHLWMQTSYAFIASYKQRILNLDRIIQSKLRQQQQPNQRPNNVPVVEHRKILQRFRQFLAEEEKFWTQLVVRLHRSFALDEATRALVALGIISEAEEPISTAPEVSDGGGVPSNGRNHFQFPSEDASTPFRPTTSEEKASWLAVLSKALVCLGDIARYRELYNEAGGRPKAGQEETGFTRRSRNRRGGHSSEDPIPRPRNYEKAEHCYQQARLLVPGDGNPSHQLAIIATYRKDSFTSLTNYYRALCVRMPYDTASENLGSVLGKALEAWKTRSRRERDRQDALPPRVQVETFRENIVVLHSLWKVGMEKGLKKMESLSRRHNKVVHEAFANLLSQRYLPTDMISNSVVLSQGALWKHRMVRSPPNPAQSRRPEVPPPPEGTSVIIEWHILEHLFDLHRALLEVGLDELRVPPPRDAPGDDLAQRITAIFRRCLPALRIASKWLRANFKYVTQDHEFDAYQEMKRTEGVEIVRDPKYQFSRISKRTQHFWEAYARFASDLSRTFNLYKLPPLTAPLDEDIDMKGFLPLKNMMEGVNPDMEGRASSEILRQAQEAHPNEWQLMRIADLIEDAKEITKLQNSPIRVIDGNFYSFIDELVEPQQVARPEANEGIVPIVQQHLLASIRDTRLDSRLDKDNEDDNMTEITSRTDDDVLRDAFQFLHASSEHGEDEEDEIVWDPRAPISPVIAPSLPSPTSHATPMTHSKPLKSPVKHSPPHSKAMSPFMNPGAPVTVPPTTAHDLFNDVISGRSAQTHLESSAPQPALLFGSDLSHRQGHSIWSTSHDASHEENSRKFTSQPNQTYQAKQTQVPAAPDAPQAMWSSPYATGSLSSPNAQHQTIRALPSAYSHQSNAHGTHQRVPSASISLSQPYASHRFSPRDSFSYPLLSNQQPIHRSDALGLNSANYISSSQMLPNAGPGMYYQSTPAAAPGYHSQHPSLHDPRLAQQHFPQSPSQLWGNVG